MPTALSRSAIAWSLIGCAGFFLLPWYAIADGFFTGGWIAGFVTNRDTAPAALQATRFGRPWLALPGIILVATLAAGFVSRDRRSLGRWLTPLGAVGFLYTLGQGFAIGLSGWSWPILGRLFGALDDRQVGLGMGALVVCAAFLFLCSAGLAASGAFRGDGFVAGSVMLVAALVGLFTFFPVVRILSAAVETDGGALSPSALAARLFTAKIWRLDCLTGGGTCGVAWNTLLLALLTAASTTGLGLAFALVVTRTRFIAARPSGSSPCCRSSPLRS